MDPQRFDIDLQQPPTLSFQSLKMLPPVETLPPEVLARIFKATSVIEDEASEKATLSNLALVCSKWRGVAQRDIFGGLVISPDFSSSMIQELASNDQHSHIGSYISTLIFALPDPETYQLPPEFPKFLRSLTLLREVKLLSASGQHLFGGKATSELRGALLHIFRLPSFTTIASSTTYFPLDILSYCPNLEDLLIRWSRFNPPNYESYNLGQRTSTLPLKLRVLQLLGKAEEIARFNETMLGEGGRISTSQLRKVSLVFGSTLPKGSGTIFARCQTVQELKIIIGVKPDEPCPFEVADSDIASLKNLRTLSFEQQPNTPEGPPDGLDFFLTGSLFGQWFLGFLANLPNPEELKHIEYVLNKPNDPEEAEEWLDAIRETAEGADQAFDDIFSEIDNLLTRQFTGLSTLKLHIPWIELKDIKNKLPGLESRGILKAYESSEE